MVYNENKAESAILNLLNGKKIIMLYYISSIENKLESLNRYKEFQNNMNKFFMMAYCQ